MTDNQRHGSTETTGNVGRDSGEEQAGEQMATDESGFGGGAAAVPDDEGAGDSGAPVGAQDDGVGGTGR